MLGRAEVIFDTLGRQWAEIVADFEISIAMQKWRSHREWLDGDDEVNKFNLAGLSILERGFAEAKARHRKARFTFWKAPVAAKSHRLLAFLYELQQEVKEAPSEDSVSRNGQLFVLQSYSERVLDQISVRNGKGERVLLPYYHD